MSNAVFPTLQGLKWGITKTPMWSTKTQKSANGRELRAAYFSYPLWKFSLSYEVLRANAMAELQTLVGFFNARQGSFDSFLYQDPDDKWVTAQAFGVGDGVTTKFQLVRDYGGFVEPVVATSGTPSIYVAGTLKTLTTHYTLVDGLVTFTTPPASGAILTWTGGFYYRVRFLQDSAEFEQFMYQLWTSKKIEFQSIK
jgi:uncharacterized protein (TIGR02217 family)